MLVAGTVVRISVCIPVRDGALYLREALASALEQDAGPLEVVVYDDGSSDGSALVAASLGDRRVRVFQGGRPRGVAAARNACLEAARGDYVAWLDADDAYMPGALARMADLLDRRPELGFVHGAFVVVDDSGRRLPDWPAPFEEETVLPRAAALAELALGNHVVTSSAVMARRDALLRAGRFSERLRTGEDWEMWLRLAVHGDVGYVATPVARYRRHTGSLTGRRAADLRRLADEAAVLRGIAAVAGRAIDPCVWRRAGCALAARWLLCAGEAFTRGARATALAATLQAARAAAGVLPAHEVCVLLAALARGGEYAVYRRSRSLLRRLANEFEDTAAGRKIRALARDDPAWQSELHAIARTVGEVVPRRARVLAVDKWDPTLLHLAGRRGTHFPDRRLLPDGYPRDDPAAVRHLEALRAGLGADYLVFPSAAFWWLEFYGGLRRHLDDTYERVWDDDRCVVYRLAATGA